MRQNEMALVGIDVFSQWGIKGIRIQVGLWDAQHKITYW